MDNFKVDIWSFGAALWQSLSGQPPFKGDGLEGGKYMFETIMTTSPARYSLRNRGLSDEVCSLLLEMLDIYPSRRPDAALCLQNPWIREPVLQNINARSDS